MVIPMFSLLIAASCDHTIKTATYHVYNHSQFQVTEIWVPARTEKGYINVLEPDESCTLISEWVEGQTIAGEIGFYMNGEDFGVRLKEEITDTRRFKPGKRISNGDIITVRIYDDHWEW